jgi:hypothetical protein
MLPHVTTFYRPLEWLDFFFNHSNIRYTSILAICQISACIFYMLLPHERRVFLNIWSMSFGFWSADNLGYGLATPSENFLRNLYWQLAIYGLSLDVSSGVWLHNICNIIIRHHLHTSAQSARALAFQKSRI